MGEDVLKLARTSKTPEKTTSDDVPPAAMAWTPSVELRRLQEAHLADDLPLDPVMETWSAAAIVEYFESGGTVLPPRGEGRPDPDPALCAFLSECDLEGLREPLACTRLDALCEALDSGRPALLALLRKQEWRLWPIDEAGESIVQSAA